MSVVRQDADTLSLIPPARLGALLSARRREAEMDLASVAHRSAGRFDVDELDRYEKGRASLTDEVVKALADLYALDAGPAVPVRAKLIIDLGQGKIQVGKSSITTPDTDPEAVLERYLALTYTMRKIAPGEPIPLRAADIDVLAHALNRTPETVKDRLIELMDAPSVKERASRLQKRVAVPDAGLLVGFTSVGAIVLAPGPGADVASGGASVSHQNVAENYSYGEVSDDWLQISEPTTTIS